LAEAPACVRSSVFPDLISALPAKQPAIQSGKAVASDDAITSNDKAGERRE
jgi:hypothetical protein